MGNSPPTFQNKLALLFHIHPGEGRQVTLLLIHAFFIGIAHIFSRTAAFTLFLLEFDATQTLPYVYVGISIIVSLASFIYLKLGERLPLAKLLVANLGFLLVVLLGFWIGLELTTARWLIFALPIGYELLYTFTNLEFWKLNGRLFNVREGKRLFGLLSSGKTLAVIIGGFLVAPLVNVIGTVNLLLVAAAAIIVALGFLVYINRAFKDRLMTPIRKTPAGDIKSTTVLLKNHYILLIVSFFALGVVTYFFIENIFYTQAQVQFPDGDQLASFIGLFFGLTAFLTLFGQSFLTSRVIKQYGLRWVGLLLSPIALLITTGLMAVGGTVIGGVVLLFSLATITKLINVVLRDTIDRPVINILYQPLSAHQRTQAQTLVEGLAYPLAIGMAGIVLSLLTTFLDFEVLQLTYVLIFILVVWLGTAILMGRRYLASLIEALSKRRLTGASIATDEKSSQLVLRQALQSQNPAVVVYALNVLQESEQENIAGYIPDLLSHPVPEVRIDALDRIEQLRLYATLDSVQQVIKVDGSAAVKAHALRVLAALGDAEALEGVYPYLDDPDPQFRLGAIIGALRNGDVAISMMAQGRLLQLAVSPNSSDRILGCEALGVVHSNNLKQLLAQLLEDEDFRVCRAALEAAGQAQYPDLWPNVIADITERETRSAAIAALVAGGETVIPIIRETIERSELQQGTLRRLARVCGRIGGDQATTLLFEHLVHPDKEVRTAVFVALSQCGFRANENEQVAVQRQIEVELSQATSILASLADISDEDDSNSNTQMYGAIAFLSESLNAEIKNFQSRLLLLLSFIYDSKSMLRAWDTLNLSYASTDERAHAVEVIDVLVPPKLKIRLLPLLEKMSLEQKLQDLSRYYPQPSLGRTNRLKEIIATTAQPYDRWLKANALYTVAMLKIFDAELAQHIATISRNDTADSFLAETATWTLAQLGQSALAQNDTHLRQGSSIESDGNKLRIDSSGSSFSLSTIEKIIILKNISVFTRIPNETLIDLADLLAEVRVDAGQLILSKGDAGDCLYIIVEGAVHVHDGNITINHLEKGDVFGEMALLDPNPRSASVTAIEDTHLLRLDQISFYQLMEDRIEVALGVIRVLSSRLRSSVNNLDELHRELETSKRQPVE